MTIFLAMKGCHIIAVLVVTRLPYLLPLDQVENNLAIAEYDSFVRALQICKSHVKLRKPAILNNLSPIKFSLFFLQKIPPNRNHNQTVGNISSQ